MTRKFNVTVDTEYCAAMDGSNIYRLRVTNRAGRTWVNTTEYDHEDKAWGSAHGVQELLDEGGSLEKGKWFLDKFMTRHQMAEVKRYKEGYDEELAHIEAEAERNAFTLAERKARYLYDRG